MSEAITVEESQPNAMAWVVFSLTVAFVFYKYILQVSPSVMTGDLMHAYGLSGTSLGVLTGVFFYTYMIMQIPSGILLDKYNVEQLTGIAVLICAFGALIFSQASSFYMACLGRLLMGFGAAFGTISYMKIASLWFPQRYSPLLSGLFGVACMSGAGAAEEPLASLVSHLGWRTTMLYCAVLGFVLFLCYLLFIFSGRSNRVVESKVQTTSLSFKKNVTTIFKNTSNIPLILYGGLAFTPVTVFGGLWGMPFLMSAYHVTKLTAASSMSLVFVGFVSGSFFVGFLGKAMQQYIPIMFGGTLLALMSLAAVVYIPGLPAWLLDGLILCFGFGSSGFVMSYTVARSINSSLIVGTVIGVFNMGDPLFGGIADPLVGKILDLNWNGHSVHHIRIFTAHSYRLGLSVLIVYLVLALASSLLIKPKAIT